MKNIFILTISAIFVLSSCSTKVSLVKRKYNGGYYVSVTKPNSAEPGIQKSVPVKEAVEKATVIKEVRVYPSILAENTTRGIAQTILNKHILRTPGTAAKSLQASASNIVTSSTQNQVIRQDLNLDKAYEAPPKKESDANLIIMVILCFFPFINLIPVYLHDGSITLNFWITLIGDILGVVPGIVFALLVVLDIVDLK
jgi:uncharacterized membrane protein YqaE (UPF0057 family)